jgi:TonB family protein
MQNANDEQFKKHTDDWLEGNFRQSDEAALKNLTASDAFQREAFEGYAATPEADHATRLARMREKIRDNGHQGAAPVRRYLYGISAAAAVIALITAAYWLLPGDVLQKEAPIVQNTPTTARPDTVLENVASGASAEPAPSDAGLSKKTAPQQAKRSPEAQGSAVAPAAKPAAPNSESLEDFALTAPQSTEPIETKDVTLSNTSSAPSSGGDREGLKAEEKADATESKFQPPPPPPVLAPATRAKSKVVPTDSRKREHRTEDRANMDSLKVLAAKKQSPPANIEPVGGWDEWKTYLLQNARLTPDARNARVSGTVVIQFGLDNNGDPQNMHFIRRLGYGCDEEAVRLIRSWEWIPGKNNLIKVEIAFLR